MGIFNTSFNFQISILRISRPTHTFIHSVFAENPYYRLFLGQVFEADLHKNIVNPTV